MGEFPNEAWHRPLWSAVGFHQKKSKKNQKPVSWCHFSGSELCSSWIELAPPCSKFGERDEAAEKKLEKSFLFLFSLFFFWYFLSESASEPRSGKCKIKITMKGWFSFPGSPGSREGRDFLPGFLCPSLCGEKIPLASLLCWNLKKIPSNPAQSLADSFS